MNQFKNTYKGIAVLDAAEKIKNKNRDIRQMNGVLIAKIDTNSCAFKKGVRVGDVIISLNQKQVASKYQFSRAISKLKKNKLYATLLIKRNIKFFFVTINFKV